MADLKLPEPPDMPERDCEEQRYEDVAPAVYQYLGATLKMVALHEANGGGPIIGSPHVMARYVLENGVARRGRHLPEGFEHGTPKNCYGNSTDLALADRDLTYVEGYALHGHLAVQHAWLTDPDGDVIDVTWEPWDADDDPSEWQYIGVPFNTDYVVEVLREKRTYGMLEWPGVYEDD